LTFFAGTAEAAWFSELRGCGAAGVGRTGGAARVVAAPRRGCS